MARPSSRAFYGDDLNQLQHDSVGINMGGVDPQQHAHQQHHHQQQQPHSYGLPSSSSSSRPDGNAPQRSPLASSRYPTSSASPLSAGPTVTSTGLGSLGFDTFDGRSAASISAYTSPRLAHAAAGVQGADKYMASSTSKDSGLGRSLSMGHAAYQGQQQASLSHQGQAYSQASPISSHASQFQGLSPSMAPASSRGTDSYRPREYGQPSYSEGSPSMQGSSSSSARSHNLLPTVNTTGLTPSHLMSTPYSPGSRASVIVESPRFANPHHELPASVSPGVSSANAAAYAPSMSTHNNAQRHSNYDDLSAGTGGRRGSSGESLSGGGFMDYVPSSSARQPSRNLSPARLSHRSSRQHLKQDEFAGLPTHQSYNAQALGGFGDSLPYAYTSSSGAPSSGSAATASHALQSPYQAQHGHAPPRGAPLSGSTPMWSGTTGTDRPSNNYDGHFSSPKLSADRADGYANSGAGLDSVTSPLRTDFARLGREADGATRERQTRPQVRGFRRVRDASDLRPNVEKIADGNGRRADPTGGFVSVSVSLVAFSEGVANFLAATHADSVAH